MAPGAVRFGVGLARISNEIDEQRGDSAGIVELKRHGVELGPVRTGLTDHMDIGIRALYARGGSLDLKYNLMPREARFAIAPRIGIGAAIVGDQRGAIVPNGGLIASYDVLPELTPYVAGIYADHLFTGAAQTGPLAPGETYAPRAGYGDGMLQMVAGVKWRASDAVSLSAEYGRWQPMQNDPGDGHKFVRNDIVSVMVHVCLRPPCD